MTIVRLRATGAANLEIRGSAIHDILWARATPESGLQHVHVIVGPGTVDITIFSTSAGEDEASRRAVLACELACSGSPMLAGWQVYRGLT